jgi:hypothetical protein
LTVIPKNETGKPEPDPGDVCGGGVEDGGGFGAAVVTFTATVSNLVGSQWLTAFTVSVPAFAGALYCPVSEIVPSVADHVTAVFGAPTTFAVNVSVPLVIDAAGSGEIVTDTPPLDVVVPGLALACAEFALSPPLFSAETT